MNLLDKYKKIYDTFKIPYFQSPIEYLNAEDVYIKRDDLLFLGCSKQRGLSYSIYKHIKDGSKKFVLSSSGNAAIVATYIALNTSKIEHLIICLSMHIDEQKLNKLILKTGLNKKRNFLLSNFTARQRVDFENITFLFLEDPRRYVFEMKLNNYISINTSEDDLSLIGFKSLGYEIFYQQNNFEISIENIFIPASSGATVIGLYKSFEELNFNPTFNVIQTSKVYSLLKPFFNDIQTETTHQATSIVDIIGRRRNQIIEIIEKTKGKPFIISTNELRNSYEALKGMNIKCSYDSALSYAAFVKAGKPKKSLLIFTG